MWQILLAAAAAAAAGSGILAKKLVNPKDDTETHISNFKSNVHKYDQILSLQPQETIFHLDDAFHQSSRQEKMEVVGRDGEIFRFSSSKGRGKETGRGFKGVKKNGGATKKKRGGLLEGGEKDVMVVHQGGNGKGRKLSVCLKKRRIGKHVAGKCESCASKDESFGWGVGLGIMYMMSAGKAEMSRLNGAMDETAKVVQELKYEISRRKIVSNMQASVTENEAEINKQLNERSRCNALLIKPSSKKNHKVTQPDPSLTEEYEYASDGITEDQEPEVKEMDQLEAEFEYELQKLSWCATEGSVSGGRTDIFEDEVLEKDGQNSDAYQYNGVSPTELDEKLSHLLIGQQESQIEELEAELHHAHSKLHKKEAELQALKDCVKRLTQFSLASASDNETEDHNVELQTRDRFEEKLELDSSNSMVGMKRTMGFDSYICSTR